jgi:hypothetical protein
MHSMSVPIFVRALQNMLAWLDKAETNAKERGFDPNNFVGLRLAPDMLPFARQIQIATDSSKTCVARLAQLEPPSWPDEEATLDELRARLEKAIAYAGSVPAEKFAGSETREVVLPLGPERSLTLTGEDFLKGFALPNFFFHVTIMYALLRHGGVPLGKLDYLGAP